MYKLLIITLLTTFLIAENVNPKPYSNLGNILYNNYEKIAHMTQVNAFKIYSKDINDYMADIIVTKKMGFSLEMEVSGVSRRDYLDKLRELSKRNDTLLRTIQSGYRNSIDNEDSQFFLQIVNNKLIDIEMNKNEIISYYIDHSEEINSTGILEELIKKNDRIRAGREAKKKRYKTKKDVRRREN